MNDTIHSMHAHRSIRRFTDEIVPREHILEATKAGQAAATSSAVQSYSALHITDYEKRQAIADLCGPQQKVHDCGAFFVICADNRRHMVMHERHARTFDQRLEAFLVSVIDATLFAQNFTLAFESMGYGTCYIGGLRNDLHAVNDILKLPDGVFPVYGLCVGRPNEQPIARPRLAPEAILHENVYPDDDTIMRDIESYDEVYRAYLQARGAAPANWSDAMLKRFEKVARPALASFYESQGARID